MPGPGFPKGYTPWNKGKKLPFEVWNKGISYTPKKGFIKGRTPWNKGTNIQTNNALVEYVKNNPPWNKGKKLPYKVASAWKKGRLPWNTGRTDLPAHSEEHRRKVSEKLRGNKSYRWKGGVTEVNRIIRCGIDYRLWRESVFARDNWTCQSCKERGSLYLHAHHIKPFSEYPELRFAIDNGITLCKSCHEEKHYA